MMQHRRFDEARTWYVVFDRPRTRGMRWWRAITGWEFAHCWAFTEAGGGIIRFEPQNWGICCTYQPVTVLAALEASVALDTTAVLSVTVEYGAHTTYPVRRGIITCVSCLKAILALRGCIFTITPWQLYKRLMRHEGCLPIKPYTPFMGDSYGSGDRRFFQTEDAKAGYEPDRCAEEKAG